MWGRLYLQIFLFKVGLFTPLYGVPYCPGDAMPFLPIMLKLPIVVRWPVVVWRCLEMFLLPFNQCSSGFSNVFIITVQPLTFIPIFYTTFVLYWVFILCTYGITRYHLDLLLLLLLSLVFWKFLCSILSKPQTGYFYLVMTSLRCHFFLF